MRTQAKVKAVNRAHKYAMEVYQTLKPIFEPLVGKPILKADGQLFQKIQKLIPDLPSTPFLQVYRYSSGYSLSYVVKTSEPDGEHTVLYYEITVCIGELKGDTLTKIYDPPQLRTDYTVPEIQQKRANFQTAKRAFEDARSALYPFGETDS